MLLQFVTWPFNVRVERAARGAPPAMSQGPLQRKVRRHCLLENNQSRKLVGNLGPADSQTVLYFHADASSADFAIHEP